MPLITFLSNFFNQSTIDSTNHPPLLRTNTQHNGDAHRDNFVWFDDDFDVGGIIAQLTNINLI